MEFVSRCETISSDQRAIVSCNVTLTWAKWRYVVLTVALTGDRLQATGTNAISGASSCVRRRSSS